MSNKIILAIVSVLLCCHGCVGYQGPTYVERERRASREYRYLQILEDANRIQEQQTTAIAQQNHDLQDIKNHITRTSQGVDIVNTRVSAIETNLSCINYNQSYGQRLLECKEIYSNTSNYIERQNQIATCIRIKFPDTEPRCTNDWTSF